MIAALFVETDGCYFNLEGVRNYVAVSPGLNGIKPDHAGYGIPVFHSLWGL